MKNKSLKVFLLFNLFIILISPFYLISEEITENSWMKEGEILLEIGKYEEAEILANSVLEHDPSNPKAEFILTKAWIGRGREEKQKGNLKLAKEFFQKAYEKWPLNENIQKELSELKNGFRPRSLQSTTSIMYPKQEELLESLNGLKEELKNVRSELESQRIENSQEKHTFWFSSLFGIQILLLICILFKIKR
ncbi:tetratricopeptide repeat protein [Leptospira sarikeiensis]|uniref:Tetratricopeptide repeat protein n=1 Tax=Leptospira sarikeiensis TaxID=2484943 RepID=A0A4R9KE92_9LEPT|nr:tetratricopeptide repeat protein [Leptospira sarikeiensis]TGL64641.1 tetratricopeptide repeat protein [Leptospira sarikeiensis]